MSGIRVAIRRVGAAVLISLISTIAIAEDLEQRVKRIVDEHAKHLIAPKDEPGAALAPGGAIGVYIDGKSYFFTYGRIDDKGTAPTRDTLFGLGSVTKTFTTSILGQHPQLFSQAVTAGALPPGYRLQPAEAPVTFEQLATFTGAVSPPRDPDNCGGTGLPVCDQKLFVEFINGVAPANGKLPAPNVYSNAGIGFLAQILMFRDGFAEFGPAETDRWLARHLFDDLNMRNTGYPPKKDAEHPLSDAFGYCEGDYRRVEYAPWVPWGAAGRVFSSAADMLRFVKANVGVRTIDGKRVPDRILDGMKEALRPRTGMSKESPQRQAFAWVSWPEELPVKSRIVGKDGGISGVSAYVAVNPDLGYGIVTLTNMAGVGVTSNTIAMMEELQEIAMELR